MAKYELVEKTEVNGEVWYHILKDGYHVNETYTLNLQAAEIIFEELIKGKPSEPIIKILKTTEVNDKNDN
jgi:hypothetical protein